MPQLNASRRAAAGRAVFWALALVVIGVLGWFIYQKKQPPESEVKPRGPELSAYMAREHEGAWGPEQDALYAVKTQEQIVQAGKDWFGQDLDFSALEGSGLEFRGAREVDMPGPPDPNLQAGRSAHFRLVTDGARGAQGQRVSLFLQKYMLPRDEKTGDILKVRTSYTLAKDPSLGAGAPDILVYRQGGLVYYIVANEPEGAALVKQTFGIPDSSGPY